MSTNITSELISEIERIKNGTSDDSNNLYELSKDGMMEILQGMVSDTGVCEQILGETYGDIYNRIGELDKPDMFYEWAGNMLAGKVNGYISLHPEAAVDENAEAAATDNVKPPRNTDDKYGKSGSIDVNKQGKNGKKIGIIIGIVAALIFVCAGTIYGVRKHQATVRAENLAKAEDILRESLELEDEWKADGDNSDKDFDRLKEMYQEMIDLGYAEGYYQMGSLYDDEDYEGLDYDKAYEYYQTAADMGSANGYNGIALLYYNGHHFDKDIDKAKEYYDLAIDMGSAYAAGSVGNYYNGDGSEGYEADMSKAMEYYIKTIELSEQSIVSQSFYSSYLRGVGLGYLRGNGVEQDVEKGLDLLTRGADLGDQNAAENLGTYYLRTYDDIGISQNVELGFKYAEMAAELGDSEGYNVIALYYEKEKEYDKAIEYIEKAIALEPERPHLYFNASGFYMDIDDYETALEYAKLSDEHGSDWAVNNRIGVCYDWLGDQDMALEYYLKSIEKEENVDGSNYKNAGDIYYSREEYEEAVEYFRQGMEHGNSNAAFMLGICYGNAKGVSFDGAKSKEYCLKAKEMGCTSENLDKWIEDLTKAGY